MESLAFPEFVSQKLRVRFPPLPTYRTYTANRAQATQAKTRSATPQKTKMPAFDPTTTTMTPTDILSLALFAAVTFLCTFWSFGFGVDFVAQLRQTAQRNYEASVTTCTALWKKCVTAFTTTKHIVQGAVALLVYAVAYASTYCFARTSAPWRRLIAPSRRVIARLRRLVARVPVARDGMVMYWLHWRRSCFFALFPRPTTLDRVVRRSLRLRRWSRPFRRVYGEWVYPVLDAVVSGGVDMFLLKSLWYSAWWVASILWRLPACCPAAARKMKEGLLGLDVLLLDAQKGVQAMFLESPGARPMKLMGPEGAAVTDDGMVRAPLITNKELDEEAEIMAEEKRRKSREAVAKKDALPPPGFEISPALRRYMKQRAQAPDEKELQVAITEHEEPAVSLICPPFSQMDDQSILGYSVGSLEQELVTSLPAEMKDGHGRIAFATAKFPDGTSRVERPGMPAMVLDLVQRRYSPMAGAW